MIIIMAETIFGIIFNRLFKIVRLRALTNHLVPGKGMVSVNIPTGGSECKSGVHIAKTNPTPAECSEFSFWSEYQTGI